MVSLQLTIDASGARKGAAEYVRSAREIRKAAGDIERALDGPTGAFESLLSVFVLLLLFFHEFNHALLASFPIFFALLFVLVLSVSNDPQYKCTDIENPFKDT